MRCKICDLVHKNTGRKKNWLEHQVCRTCSYFLEIFGANCNYLKEYWNGGSE